MNNQILNRSIEAYKTLEAEHTAKEINQQPQLWQETLNALITHKSELQTYLDKTITAHTKIIFTGAGTSEFVGNAIVPYIKQHLHKTNIYSISTTDLLLSPYSYFNKEDEILLISCARSGDSPESVAAVNLVTKLSKKASHLFITCNSEGALAKLSKDLKNVYLFIIDNANDLGFAMTGSFTSMLLVSALLFQLDSLTSIQNNFNAWASSINGFFLEQSHTIKELVAHKKDRIICLGSGGFKGIAQEAHLKILELSASLNTAIFDSPLGFRHGPKSVLNNNSIIFMFMSDNEYTRLYEADLLKELMATKGNHYVVAVTPTKIENAKMYCHTQIILPKSNIAKHPTEYLYYLSGITIAQMYALENSLNLSITPDNPSKSGSVNRVVKGVTIYQYK